MDVFLRIQNELETLGNKIKYLTYEEAEPLLLNDIETYFLICNAENDMSRTVHFTLNDNIFTYIVYYNVKGLQEFVRFFWQTEQDLVDIVRGLSYGGVDENNREEFPTTIKDK